MTMCPSDFLMDKLAISLLLFGFCLFGIDVPLTNLGLIVMVMIATWIVYHYFTFILFVLIFFALILLGPVLLGFWLFGIDAPLSNLVLIGMLLMATWIVYYYFSCILHFESFGISAPGILRPSDLLEKCENLDEKEKTCSVCLEKPIAMIRYVPCNHMMCCQDCIKILLRGTRAKCPICRSLIENIERIY